MSHSVLTHFYYLLSHTPSLPPLYPTVSPYHSHCLLAPCLAVASVPVDEIVMVTVISCRVDKKGERLKGGTETYGAQAQLIVNILFH